MKRKSTSLCLLAIPLLTASLGSLTDTLTLTGGCDPTHHKMTHPLQYPKKHNHVQSHPSCNKMTHPLWYPNNHNQVQSPHLVTRWPILYGTYSITTMLTVAQFMRWPTLFVRKASPLCSRSPKSLWDDLSSMVPKESPPCSQSPNLSPDNPPFLVPQPRSQSPNLS
jgi:hypothetical protein